MVNDDISSDLPDRTDENVTDETGAELGGEGEDTADSAGTGGLTRTRERLGEEAGDAADRAVEEFDQRIVDLLSWLLDTETRARIYVYLRQHPHSTSNEVANGTGLYPSTVREALADLHDEGTVNRQKRENAGAGNNPYEYEAIAPSDLVRDAAGRVQEELNTVFNLDQQLGDGDGDVEQSEPVTIEVEDR